jgi:hypothetical protein
VVCLKPLLRRSALGSQKYRASLRVACNLAKSSVRCAFHNFQQTFRSDESTRYETARKVDVILRKVFGAFTATCSKCVHNNFGTSMCKSVRLCARNRPDSRLINIHQFFYVE